MSQTPIVILSAPSGQIARVSREKLCGLGRHEGVLLPDGRIVDTSYGKNTRIQTFDAFSAGRPVQIEYAVPAHQHSQALRVLNELLAENAPYDAINNNCEIFSRRIALQKPESPQVGFWAVVGLGLTAWLISRGAAA